jgi:phage terminase small subunit
MLGGMTARQKAFADAILAGIGPSEAYRRAGYKVGSPKVVSVKAQETLRQKVVKAYLAERRDKQEKRNEWTREQMLKTLREIAEDHSSPKAARTGAIAQASKMLGWDAPAKVEHGGGLVIRWES